MTPLKPKQCKFQIDVEEYAGVKTLRLRIWPKRWNDERNDNLRMGDLETVPAYMQDVYEAMENTWEWDGEAQFPRTTDEMRADFVALGYTYAQGEYHN
jgi:hypothetical protein